MAYIYYIVYYIYNIYIYNIILYGFSLYRFIVIFLPPHLILFMLNAFRSFFLFNMYNYSFS